MRHRLVLVLVINTAIGAWLGVTAIAQFTIFLNGGTLYEPNSIIATSELVIACLFTLWFMVGFPVLLIRGLKENV